MTTPLKLGIIMDPIERIHLTKDSSFAMLLEAQARGWPLWYMQQEDVFSRDGITWARATSLRVKEDPSDWFTLGSVKEMPLGELDIVLMRKDPPFNMKYIYTTYLLDQAEQAGTLVVNKPQSLRDYNEKMATLWFPQCCVPSLTSSSIRQLNEFIDAEKDTIIKPLDGMGGHSIFRVTAGDVNRNVILETLTENGQQFAMLQRFIPEVRDGDKRILLVDGVPIPYGLARIPAAGETRGNLAAGGRAEGIELSARDRYICEQVGPTLREKGILFAGLDVIGDYLTEINITSPTCIRELDRFAGINISAQLLDCLQNKVLK